MQQKFQDRIGDIITDNTDSEESTFQQLLKAAKQMAIAFWEVNSHWEPMLGSSKARNIFDGSEREIDELMGEFLASYRTAS